MASSSSSTATVTASASASSTSAASGTISVGSNLKVVGIILAVVSGLLIGSSFVFKKKGLLRAQAGHTAGEGVAYLKSVLWWLGMTMMIMGELCNFAAYAFIEALIVTPLGALSVVVCAILSSIFLKEKLSFFGWMGCALCILGSIIIALNGPSENSVGNIRKFQKLFLAPGFLAYGGVLIASALSIIFYFGPRYGKKHMLWYIMVCSMIGGISVSVTTGLGAAIVLTAQGQNQFDYWFIYFLAVFVITTLVTEVYYLNVALALFNTAMVTPTYYVIFTFFSMVTSVILYQGLSATVSQIITVVLAFIVICLGITILQMSKVDPEHFKKLDRRSTMLLQAARHQTERAEEKEIEGIEEPGIDALRGSFGTIGSIIRARSVRTMSQSSRGSSLPRTSSVAAPYDAWVGSSSKAHLQAARVGTFGGMTRHQLYDAPVPSAPEPNGDQTPLAGSSTFTSKRPTIKFDTEDVVHQYNPTLLGASQEIREYRPALASPRSSERVLSLSHDHSVEGQVGGQSGPRDDGYPLQPMRGPRASVEPALSLVDSSRTNLLGGSTPGSTPSQSGGGSPRNLSSPSHERGGIANAPPAKHGSFGPQPERDPHVRTDVRDAFVEPVDDPFDPSLLSFPSITDSALSQSVGWDPQEQNLPDSPESQHSPDSGHRGRSTRKYPRGTAEDDREESIGLFNRRDDEGDGDDPLPQGGIRLVNNR